MEQNSADMHTHPIIGAVTGLLTGAGGIAATIFVADVALKFTIALLSIYLLILQIKKAKS